MQLASSGLERSPAEVGDSSASLFLHELRQLPTCACCKAQVLRLINSFAGERLYLRRQDTIKVRRLEDARHWLQQGLSRADVMRRLCDAHGVSGSTAYRVIARAISRTK